MPARTAPTRRTRRTRWGMKAVAALTVMATLAPAAPAQAGPLDGLLGGLKDLLDPILDPVLEALDHTLQPVTGLIADLTGLPVDTAVSELVEGTVDGLLGTIDRVTGLDPESLLGNPQIDQITGLIPLEPADSLLEDVVYPGVIEPVGPIVGPVLGAVGVVTEPLGLDGLLDSTIGLVRDVALEPVGLDPAAYVIRAATPDGETTRNALIDVPLPVDVTGDGADDVSVELRFITARPSLRVTRLPGAPADLPLAIEAIIAPNGYADPSRIAFGYDALAADAPGVFRATVADLGTTSGDLAVELHTVSPGSTLALTASLYDQGPGTDRIEPTDVRASFTPVPADVQIDAPGALGGGDDVQVGIDVSEPSRVEVALRTEPADGRATEVAAVLDQVPGSVDLTVGQGDEGIALDYTASAPVDSIALRYSEEIAEGTRSAAVGFEGVQATSADFVVSAEDLSYEASAPIEALTVEVIDPRGVVDRATVLRARLVGLPGSLGIDIGDDGGLGLDAGGGTLGLVELQLTSSPDLDVALPADVDGVLLRDLPAEYVLFARVTDLRAVSVTPSPLAASLRTAGGRPFVASIDQGTSKIDARLSALPADVDIALTEGGDDTTLSYGASAPVDQLGIDIVQDGLDASLVVDQLPTTVEVAIGDDGFAWTASDGVPHIAAELRGASGLGRADSVRADLTGVPATMSLGLGGEAVSLDAPGGIDLVEVLATDGTTEVGVPEGSDGLVLQDTPEGYAVALRLNGLEALSFSAEPLSLTLATAGGRPFEVLVDQAGGDGAATTVRALLEVLPASVSLSLADLDGEPRLEYSASESIDALYADVLSRSSGGGETAITLEVLGLPSSLTLVLGEDGIDYSADAAVPSMKVEVNDDGGLLGRADRLLVDLVDLPVTLSVSLADGNIGFDAGAGMLGSLEALLTNGPELALPADTDGLILVDEPTDFAAAIRMTGLHAMSFDLGDATALSLRTAGDRLFEVDVRQAGDDGGSTEMRATLDRLPAEVTLALAGALGAGGEGFGIDYTASGTMDELRADLTIATPGEPTTEASVVIAQLPTELALEIMGDGSVRYTASATVPTLSVDLVDPAGLFGSATTLRLRATDLPTGIDAAIDEAGGLSAQTTGGPLGQLEALFTDGEEIGMVGDSDGIVFRDTPELFAAYVRLTGLSGVTFAPTEGGTELALDTVGGRVFAVDAVLENPDEGTSTAIAATLEALPTTVALNLADDPDGGLALTWSASDRMARLHGDLELTDAEGTTAFELEVLDLPTTISFALDSETGALRYTASGRAGQLQVLAENPDGVFLAATELQALLQDLPNELEIGLGGETGAGVSLDAKGGQLGLLEVLATSGPNLAPAPGVDGVVLRDTPDEFVLGMRVTDLRKIVVQPDPVAFTIGTAGGSTFVLDALLDGGQVIPMGDGAVDVDAVFTGLPSLVTLGFGLDGEQQALDITASSVIDEVSFSLVQTPAEGTPLTAAIVIDDVPTSLQLAIDVSGAVSYTASAPVPSLELDAHDPAGLFNRADKLQLRLLGLPLVLEVGLSETGAVEIQTGGGRLGQLEALAYLNTPAALAPEMDGVVLEDLTNDYRVFARFTAIDEASVTQVPQPNVKLVGAGGRPLSIGLYESAPGKASPIPNVAFTTASLVDAPPSLELALLPGDPGTINVAYNASATADTLGFQTNSGDRWITSASISNPVPLSFVACQTGTSSCAPGLGQSNANVGSFAFFANQHTTLNVLDCSRPLNANCTANSGTQFTNVNNLRVKTLQFAGDIDQGTIQAEVKLYANTVPTGLPYNSANADTLSGSIRNRDGDTRLTFTFGNGFKAWDRYKHVDRFPSLPFFGMRTRGQRGGITCASGTDLSVTVKFIFDLTFNANSLLC